VILAHCHFDIALLSSRPNSIGLAHTTEPPGQKPLVVNEVVVGPFDEEEEGTGVASDVVKVKDEDPATPGSPDLRNDPGTVTIPQYRVNKTMQHTHTLWRGASTCVGS